MKKNLLKRYGSKAKELGGVMKLVGKTATAIATEPFTNNLLNRHTEEIDKRHKEGEVVARQRDAALKQRYSRK